MSQPALNCQPQHQLKILVISDVSLYRDGLIGQLNLYKEFLSEGYSSHSPLSSEQLNPFNIILIDISLPKISAIIKRIQELHSPVKIILLNLFDQPQRLFQCIQLGIHACISQSDNIDCLRKCIEKVCQEGQYFSPDITQSLIQQVVASGSEQTQDVRLSRLTNRQLRVLELMETGQSNKEIAKTLSIEVATVKNHVHSILDKLRVRSRCEAAALLRRQVEA
ncbi:MAG: response regulator transcription factor [Gammaproteobacteria bacterium]|nr:response regulator transcription factor [Gammaproteobacteria bacterium]